MVTDERAGGRRERNSRARLLQPRRRTSIGRAGREKIARRFSVDKAVEGYRTIIIETVLRANRSTSPSHGWQPEVRSQLDWSIFRGVCSIVQWLSPQTLKTFQDV